MTLSDKYINSYKRKGRAIGNFLYVLLVIFLFILMALLLGCSAKIPAKFEDQLLITKKYSGQVRSYYYEKRCTIIITDICTLKVCKNIAVPDSAHCWVRTEPCYQNVHPDIRARLEAQFLSFNGVEYRIKTW